MRQGLIGHCTAKNCHRTAAHGASRENDTMYLMLGYLFRYFDTLFDRHTMPAVIPHIRLDHYCHIIFGMCHHFVQHLIHEPYTVLKRAAVLIAAVVGSRSDELGKQIGMTRMDLHAVKAALSCPIDCFTEFLYEVLYLRHFEGAVNSRAIEIKPCICAHGDAMTGVYMRHVAAVSQLDTRFRTLRMDSVGHLLHIGDYLRTNIELTVKGHTAQIHCAVRYRRHTYSAASYTHVIVL